MVVEVADAIHLLTGFLDEAVIETENAPHVVVEAFPKPDGVESAEIPARPGDESIQRTLIAAIQEIPCDILDVFLSLLTEQQAGEISVEMIPLRLRKTRPIGFQGLTKSIFFSGEEHHPSHPILADGNDVLLSEIYGGFRKVQKFCC
jgi:hypothetical protein